MPVGLSEPADLLPVDGVKLASTACGIKNNGKDDLVVLSFEAGSVCAATFTRNAFCAAPVNVARNHLKLKPPRAFLVNSGNANAGTGKQGLRDAEQSCGWLAEKLGCDSDEVLPFSTGVIGQALPMEKLQRGIAQSTPQLQATNWLDAAHGIMTTDIVAKAVSRQVEINGETITLTGIAKGSGMIKPDMATMLCFIATDARIDAALLQQYLNAAVDKSFNAITVDGDTSTNDACMLVATGKTQTRLVAGEANATVFYEALERVCMTLAQAIVHSPLVKTALFASDPNWGRILAAVGRSGLAALDVEKVTIFLGDVCIVRDGGKSESYTEEQGQRVMNEAEITIRVELGRGESEATIWTTDLSHDYVTINSEYRS